MKIASNQVDAQAFIRDVLDWCASLPEVPLYRRRDEPARAAAKVSHELGLELLRRPLDWSNDYPEWKLAIERHLAWLQLLADGQVEAAQREWHVALTTERAASSALRLWERVDAMAAPVFEKVTGSSRFDPRPAASLAVKLVCPHCKKVESFQASALMAQHRFRCPDCRSTFSAYLAQVRQFETRPIDSGRRYFFQLEGLGHELSRLSVDDRGVDSLVVGRGDLMAFLYSPETSLRAVMNLNSSRILWLAPGGPCFVVTVAFGPEARELTAFREFRDAQLMTRAWGRAFVSVYYRHGPALAEAVSARPRVKRAVKTALSLVHRLLLFSHATERASGAVRR